MCLPPALSSYSATCEEMKCLLSPSMARMFAGAILLLQFANIRAFVGVGAGDRSRTDPPFASRAASNDADYDAANDAPAGQLEQLKKEEARLAALLASVRQEKLSVLRSRPLSIGVVGFGRFGQFIARSFAKYGNVFGSSRGDYANIAKEMGAGYTPLADLGEYIVTNDVDVLVLAVSIVSFEDTVKDLVPYLERRLETRGDLPLVVDVASVKEHPRNILLDNLPKECDVLCTHPMFGPDSASAGWQGQTFVYERTRIDGVLVDDSQSSPRTSDGQNSTSDTSTFMDEDGIMHDVHELTEAHVEGMDRISRFLSIWEEEGCQMVRMSCSEHDEFAANSQFITHLTGRILGAQGLKATPVDTMGFKNLLRLIETTNADSFELFYGLYKYNSNSGYTIGRLRGALDDVVGELLQRDGIAPGVFDRR